MAAGAAEVVRPMIPDEGAAEIAVLALGRLCKRRMFRACVPIWTEWDEVI